MLIAKIEITTANAFWPGRIFTRVFAIAPVIKIAHMEVKNLDISELQEFMEANNLQVKLIKAWENDEEIAYTYQGYKDNKLIFDGNEFYIRKALRLDVFGVEIWDIIAFLHHEDWIYDMFIPHKGVRPLKRYMEGIKLFKKALNLYGPPMILIDHNGARVHIKTNKVDVDKHDFNFYISEQVVAEIAKYSIITPSPLGRPANLITKCKACFYVRDAHDHIMSVYWPA